MTMKQRPAPVTRRAQRPYGENSGQAKEQAKSLACSYGGSAEGGEPSARGPGDAIPWAVSRGGSLWPR